MHSVAIKQPTKSILKHRFNSITLDTDNSNVNSWFSSKLNSINNDTSTVKINNLFSNFRKQPKVVTQDNLELTPKQIRRVRFSVTDMTQEYIFTKEDIIIENKKQNNAEPIHIQNLGQLLSLYESVCKNKQEPPIHLFVSTLISQPHATFLTRLDLSNQLIDRYSISPLADVMGINFGLKELILNNCGLEDYAIQVLMNSLLENDNINSLSLAKNTKLNTLAFKYIAVYIKGSCQLTSLDLSCTQPDKQCLEYLLAATIKCSKDSKSPSLNNLQLNECNLKTAQLQVLSTGIRKPNSTIRQLSIKGNKFLGQGALSIGVMLRDYDQQDMVSGLDALFLDGNNLGQSIQYIAQALKRNQCLRQLSLSDCKLTSKDFTQLCEALRYNQNLQILDVSHNTFDIDSTMALRNGIKINRSLREISLANTGLYTEAAINLAEIISENNSLVRLDLSNNPKIHYRGLSAISTAMKINCSITFIDINIPMDNKEMIEIHNGIIIACTRNAQPKSSTSNVTPIQIEQNVTPIARLSLEERLAAVTKGKNIRPSTIEKNKAHEDPISLLIQEAFDKVSDLEDIVSNKQIHQEHVQNQCKQLHSNICLKIPEISESSKLELLLTVNDRLITAIQSFEAISKIQGTQGYSSSSSSSLDEIDFSGSFEIGDDDDDDDDDYDYADELTDILDEEDTKSNCLKELLNEIDIEESNTFLKAQHTDLEEISI